MSNDDRDGNTGRARDHMANERTFLAWQRTGVIAALALAPGGSTSG